ncbi:MAG: beta-galactosidase [Bacteroidales bacterium]|nr:beta-galactosidase [Bacteroidales bacterium]
MRKILILMTLLSSLGQAAWAGIPVIGAQVFIEPGQSDAEVDGWFRTLRENGMDVCRIRLFEEYIHTEQGWDFSLFDRAFQAAARHDIRIFLTLFPADPDRSIGGFKFPFTDAHEADIATYIKEVVTHYRSHPNLLGWVLLNEPGTEGVVPDTPYTQARFAQWKTAQPAWESKGYARLMDFDKEAFLVDHTSEYLGWLAAEIRKYDVNHELHVNNHQIFDNIAEYDFPVWRRYLTSLGASAHASWHFGYFRREQYAVAMSANCHIVRSGAGPIPFWVTELQGGNNTYSARKPFCPTADEITQWMWTGITSGISGLIFWSLNPRAVGGEAGEWGLVNFQNGPSDRLKAAKEVIDVMHAHPEVFSKLEPAASDISLIYLRESLWAEKKVQLGDLDDPTYEGRHQGGVIKSVLGIYEMLLENGIDPQLAEFGEYDWTRSSYKGKTVILANQVCLPKRSWEALRNFVKKGGKLIVEGLTGYYDEDIRCRFQTGFPLEDVFGGCLEESKCSPGDFSMEVNGITLPVHLWQSFIHPGSVTSLHNRFGQGEVFWLPSCVGIGARRAADYSMLAQVLLPEMASLPAVRLTETTPGLMVQRFRAGGKEAALLINKSGKAITPAFTRSGARILYSSKQNSGPAVEPEECRILIW